MSAPLRFGPAAKVKNWSLFGLFAIVVLLAAFLAPTIAGDSTQATLSATTVDQGVLVSLVATNINSTYNGSSSNSSNSSTNSTSSTSITFTMVDELGVLYMLPAQQVNESLWQAVFPVIPQVANITAYDGIDQIANLIIGFGGAIEQPVLPEEDSKTPDGAVIDSPVDNVSSGPSKDDGSLLSNITLLKSFGGGASSTLPNLTQMRVYNVTGLATPRVGGSLVNNGTNTTFNLSAYSSYRVEFTIVNKGIKWNIAGADVAQHAGLDSSWSVDTNKIWYKIGTVNYTGGTFSGGTVAWDLSQGGALNPDESGAWFYIFNVTTIPVDTHRVNFTINDTNNNSGSTDSSIFNEVFIRELVMNASSVDIVSSEFVEGRNVTLNITVFNRGNYDATGFTFQAWDNTTGELFYQRLLNVSKRSYSSFLLNWTAEIGSHKLQFRADTLISTNGSIVELYGANNVWNKTINISAWHTLMGNVTQIVRLSGATSPFHRWANITPQGIIYASDSDATISWSQLQALGRTQTNASATDDFAQADTLLGMIGFPDSVQSLYAQDASTPLQTTTRVLDGRVISNIPYINSTNTSSFITGIAWDKTLDSNGEFDSSEAEDLVFFTQINASKRGLYGRYDYEIMIPSTLENTKGGTQSTYLYLEIT